MCRCPEVKYPDNFRKYNLLKNGDSKLAEVPVVDSAGNVSGRQFFDIIEDAVANFSNKMNMRKLRDENRSDREKEQVKEFHAKHGSGRHGEGSGTA